MPAAFAEIENRRARREPGNSGHQARGCWRVVSCPLSVRVCLVHCVNAGGSGVCRLPWATVGWSATAWSRGRWCARTEQEAAERVAVFALLAPVGSTRLFGWPSLAGASTPALAAASDAHQRRTRTEEDGGRCQQGAEMASSAQLQCLLSMPGGDGPLTVDPSLNRHERSTMGDAEFRLNEKLTWFSRSISILRPPAGR
jgi:hypothetical protein